MKNGQKSVFFLFLVILVTALSVTGRAEEEDERGEAELDGYEESTPITPTEEKELVKETQLPEALDVTPVETPIEATASVAESAPIADIPSGLLEVSGYKYPVYLFVPKDYKNDRTYSMIMIASAESITAEQQIEYLTGLANRKSIFLLAPYVLWPKSGTTPDRLDEWLLSVKNEIVERFPINKNRVYLVGKGSGAQYAGYLAIKYPDEFAAAALLGEAWEGPFSKLVDPRSGVMNQIPFYVALKTDGEAKARNHGWFEELQQKGYMIHLVDYQSDAELDELDFKKSFFDWLEEASQSWAAVRAESQKTWKGKLRKGVKNFFTV